MQRLFLIPSLLLLPLATACGGRQPIAATDGGPLPDVLNVQPPPVPDHGLVADVTLVDPCRRWTCTGSQVGDTCTADFATLPPHAGSPWRCHQGQGTWHCDSRSPYGGVPVPPPPACSEGWTCEQIGIVGSSPDGTIPYPGYDVIHRCSRPLDARDTPPQAILPVVCVRGSAFGGTRCELVPESLPPPGFPSPNERCTPGRQRWCDGLQYSGW